jgi:hypothetical protein
MRPVPAASLRTLAAVVVGAVLLASCGTANVSPSVSPPASPLAPSPTPAPATSSPSTSPSPSTADLLSIATLPAVALDPSTLTALCDPTPSQTNIDAGESMIACPDVLALALRAFKTVVTAPVTRLYLLRPACPTVPCTADELDIGVVFGWTSQGAMSVALDSRLTTVTAPVPEPVAAWPDPGAPTVPPIQRPVIPGAPMEVATRTPYPFCGRDDTAVALKPAVARCFIDAVIVGRPAEFIEQVYDTEGGAILQLYRFSGQGAPVRYEGENGVWSRQAGGLILPPPPPASVGVDFEPWPETYAVVR